MPRLRIAVAAGVVSIVCCTQVLISNVIPRRSTNGQIMDAHDGNIVYDTSGQQHVWYAASYGNCTEPSGSSGCSGAGPNACGFRFDHNVSVFTSPDLATWTAHPPALQCALAGLPAPTAVLFCPKVLYNAKTSMYVMWFNWIDGANFSASYYAVATSSTPVGPFRLVSPRVSTLAWTNTGDFGLFQDDDGSAYIIYTAHIQGYPVTHEMSIEQLSDDYTASVGQRGNSGFFGAAGVEAPTMFKRGSVYYAVFGACCCYCQSGSPVVVYTSSAPLGPYTAQNVLDPPSGAGVRWDHLAGGTCSRSQQLDTSSARNTRAKCSASASGVTAQQSDIFAWTDATGAQQFMWYGDRWQSAPDGIKGHDFTYWSPLAFAPDGNITSIGWVDQFAINP